MADVEFFWDPVCPWAWITSRWVVNVLEERPMEVDWRFISLRMVNHDKDYEKDFSPGYERGHMRGLELLRVAAAVRAELGPDAVLPLYTVFGRTIHNERNREVFDEPAGVEAALAELGYPLALAAAARTTEHDDLIWTETNVALERCGGNIGTPVLSFSARRPELLRAGDQRRAQGQGGRRAVGRGDRARLQPPLQRAEALHPRSTAVRRLTS